MTTTIAIEVPLRVLDAYGILAPPRNASPMESPPGEVTALLHAWAGGDRGVEPRLFELVAPDLHKLAGRLLRRERADHTLQPTALLNEVYCRLVQARERDWQNRTHFFAVAARAMRHLLIDYARARPAGIRVPIDGLRELLRGREDKIELAVAIHGLLSEIEASHPDWCTIVELKFFVGLTDQETAEALGMPLRTVQRKFSDARRWLYEKLQSGSCQTKTNTTSL